MKQQKYNCSNETHNGQQAFKICLNKDCRDYRVYCFDCHSQGLHNSHLKDCIEIINFQNFLNQKAQECDQFVIQLQGPLNKVQELMDQLQNGVRQKYLIREDILINLNRNQLNEVLNEILHMNETKNLFVKLIKSCMQSLFYTLTDCLQELHLEKILFNKIQNQNQIKLIHLTDIAVKVFQQKQYDVAFELFNQSLLLNSEDPIAYFYKGECLIKKKKFIEALEQYNKSIKIKPNTINTIYAKGKCLKLMGDFKSALVWFELALQIDPKHFKSLFQKSECLRKGKRYNQALEVYEIVLKIQPSHLDTLKGICECLIQTCRFDDEAIKFYELVLSTDSKHFFSLYGKGEWLMKNSRVQEALEFYKQASEIDSNNFYLSNRIGECLRLTKQFQLAQTCYDAALIIAPKDITSIYGKSYCLRKQNKYQQAASMYTKVLEIDPEHIMALTEKAQCLINLKEFKGAIILLDQALGISPNYYKALREKGSLLHLIRYVLNFLISKNSLYNQNQYDEAIVYFDLAIAEKNDCQYLRKKRCIVSKQNRFLLLKPERETQLLRQAIRENVKSIKLQQIIRIINYHDDAYPSRIQIFINPHNFYHLQNIMIQISN